MPEEESAAGVATAAAAAGGRAGLSALAWPPPPTPVQQRPPVRAGLSALGWPAGALSAAGAAAAVESRFGPRTPLVGGHGLVWATVWSGGPRLPSHRPSQRQPQHRPPQQLIPGCTAAAASGPGRRSGSSREPPPLSTTDVRPTPEVAETDARGRGDRRRRPPVPQFYKEPTLPIVRRAIETTILLKTSDGNPRPWKRLRVRYGRAPESTIKEVKEAMLLRGDLPDGINETTDFLLALGKSARPGRVLNDFETLANISSLEPAADASAGRQRRSLSV